jgi:hypothetical protein
MPRLRRWGRARSGIISGWPVGTNAVPKSFCVGRLGLLAFECLYCVKLKILIVLTAIATTLGWQADAQIYDTNITLVETLAGSSAIGLLNGLGAQAEFSNPSQIVSDSYGNFFVLDVGNKLIRKVAPDGTVSNIAGGGTEFEGYGTNVSLGYSLFGSMTIDDSNTIWIDANLAGLTYLLNISDSGFVSIENVSVTGLSVVSGNSGSICADTSNNIYYYGGSYVVTNAPIHLTNVIYRYFPSSDTIQPFAFVPSLGSPVLTIDSTNNIFVWDNTDDLIRKIDQSGNVTIIAGNSTTSNADGMGTTASITNVAAMAADNSGNIFLACGNSIRKITTTTNVVTIAGSFTQSGYSDGIGSNALFSGASGVCVSQGSIFVADSKNERIRKILVNPVPISGASVSLNTYPGLTITGIVNRAYQIQASPDLNTWNVVVPIVLLNSSPYLWFDPNPVNGNKFYRAFLLP